MNQVRSAAWVERMSFAPSVINYTRFNYVAQPEDEMPPEMLVQRLGPADVYSIRWGYRPMPEAESPDEERAILQAWIREQDAMPMLRYRGNGMNPTDPDATYEAVEVTDRSQPQD